MKISSKRQIGAMRNRVSTKSSGDSRDPMNSLFSFFATAALVLSVVGYPVISFFFDENTSRQFTVPFRVVVLILLIGVSVSSIIRIKEKPSLAMFLGLLFVGVYTCRFIHDSFIFPIPEASHTITERIAKYFGICLPTFFGYFFVRDLSLIKRAGNWIFWIASGVSLYGIIFNTADMVRRSIDTDVLNGSGGMTHIEYGHVALLATGIGIHKLANREYANRLSAIAIALIIPSTFAALLLAGSRSAAIGFGLVLLFESYRLIVQRRFLPILISVVFVVSFFVVSNAFLSSAGFDFVTRFLTPDAGNAFSNVGRETMIQGAIGQFEDHPLFGDAMLERTSETYPHNVFLEAFMATGLFGGLLFFGMYVDAFRNAWRASRAPGYGWLFIFLIQTTSLSFFSGSLYSVSDVWIVLGLFVGATLRVDAVDRTMEVGWTDPTHRPLMQRFNGFSQT